jgi:phage-related protein
MPLARPVTGERFWELRVQTAGNIVRVFYFALRGRRIMLLHGFVKKDRKTPRAELQVARRRYDEVVRRGS